MYLQMCVSKGQSILSWSIQRMEKLIFLMLRLRMAVKL